MIFKTIYFQKFNFKKLISGLEGFTFSKGESFNLPNFSSWSAQILY